MVPPVSPIQDASSTTATVPRRSIANRHVNRRLHMYANRKSGMSKLFEPPWPSYTPYHMVAESRPLYLLIRLINPPLRLQRRYQAHPPLWYSWLGVPSWVLRGQVRVPYLFNCVTLREYELSKTWVVRASRLALLCCAHSVSLRYLLPPNRNTLRRNVQPATRPLAKAPGLVS